MGRMVAESPAIPGAMMMLGGKRLALTSHQTEVGVVSARSPFVLVVENPPPGSRPTPGPTGDKFESSGPFRAGFR